MAKLHRMSDTDVAFHCPGCEGGHGIRINSHTNPPNWEWNGSMESPTFTPSIKVEDGRGGVCHTFVKDGNIQFLDDCTHALKGQTVAIPEWD